MPCGGYCDMSESVAGAKQVVLSLEFTLLLDTAREVRSHAYAKYSKFYVGSALLTADGRTVIGANVENISYGLTICAERNAVTRAIIDGYSKIKAIAVCANSLVFPCGACRQFINEFCDADCVVILGSADPHETPVITTMGKLLPMAFDVVLPGQDSSDLTR